MQLSARTSVVTVVLGVLTSMGLACGANTANAPTSSARDAARSENKLADARPSAHDQDVRRVVVFEGACDASGGVALSARLLVVGDDEDNVLRVYDAELGGPPIVSVDVSPALSLPLAGKKNSRAREVDLEAATRLGDRAFWMTSHGRSRKGKLRPERLRFFATTAPSDGEGIALVGAAYTGLLRDLLEEPALAVFDLRAAAELPPKEPGGLNIEGLTATPQGTLLIAFRNPIPGGKALLVPLLNPRALVETPGTRAEFGEPRLLALGGLGVRSLSYWRGRYLIVAGDYAAGAVSRLHVWDGQGDATPLAVPFEGFNPEGFFSPEELDRVLILSDDGSLEIEGIECKRRPASERRFRGVWVRLAP